MNQDNPLGQGAGRKLRRQGTLVLIAVFALGGLLGVTGARLLEAQGQAPEQWRRVEGRSQDRLPPHFQRLGLSEEQRDETRAIMERYRPSVDSIMADMRPRFRAVMGSAHDEISAILTPEQRETLDSLREEMKGRAGQHGLFGSPRGPGAERRGP
ncbi:MAG: hypothetical protein ABFS14_08505 [Gemmatimonadota bacterium]